MKSRLIILLMLISVSAFAQKKFSVKLSGWVGNTQYSVDYLNPINGRWQSLNGVDDGKIGMHLFTLRKAKIIGLRMKTFNDVKKWQDSIARISNPSTIIIR